MRRHPDALSAARPPPTLPLPKARSPPMSRIRDITVVPLQFAPPEPYGSSRGLVRARGGNLVLLDTEDGAQGIGEMWGPAPVARAWADVLKPFYVGRSVFAQRGAAQEVLARM